MRISKFVFSTLLSFTLVNAKLVMIIRHGEKINDNVTNLSDKGKARAECLIEAFGTNGVYATPQKIYAQCPTENKQSTRPRDTVVPLANHLGLEVDLTYTSGKFKKLVKDIKSSPEEVFLISWSNDKIDNIADEFDIKKAPKWEGEVFDDIWVITDGTTPYVKNGANITPTATYLGKKEMSMVVVKENVDTCIAQLLNSSNQSQTIQNEQIQQQNSQYANVQQQAQTQQQAPQYGQTQQQTQIEQQNSQYGQTQQQTQTEQQNQQTQQQPSQDDAGVGYQISSSNIIKASFAAIVGAIGTALFFC